METNKNISAFPIFDSNRAGMDYECMEPGMTLRDYFAAKAMLGVIMHPQPASPKDIAATAYEIADAMLRARGE